MQDDGIVPFCSAAIQHSLHLILVFTKANVPDPFNSCAALSWSPLRYGEPHAKGAREKNVNTRVERNGRHRN
jgi:hypothetical protein